MSRRLAAILAVAGFAALLGLGLLAPEHQSQGDPARAYLGWLQDPPFGTDQRGRPLWEYAAQGASVIAGPAFAAALVVAGASVVGGLLRCVQSPLGNAVVVAFGEVVGSLPRMVVLLVTALVLPAEWRGLLPLALCLAVLASPNAMDEAGAVAERLGGARFVEALRAHGFGWARVFLYHIALLNLRPVVVRQAAEMAMQVGFLEMALSYLSLQQNQPGFTHPDGVRSWADLLQLGYPSLVLDVPTGHALALGLGLAGLLTVTARFATTAARAR